MAIFKQESSMYYVSLSQNKIKLFTQRSFILFFRQNSNTSYPPPWRSSRKTQK